MKTKLNQVQIDFLTDQPETGMGYQKVNIVMSDDNTIDNVTVLNSEYLETDENIDINEITHITLV